MFIIIKQKTECFSTASQQKIYAVFYITLTGKERRNVRKLNSGHDFLIVQIEISSTENVFRIKECFYGSKNA